MRQTRPKLPMVAKTRGEVRSGLFVCGTILLVAGVGVAAGVLLDRKGPPLWAALLIGLIVLFCVATGGACIERALHAARLDEDGVSVERPVGRRAVPWGGIQEIELSLAAPVRNAGGGLLGMLAIYGFRNLMEARGRYTRMPEAHASAVFAGGAAEREGARPFAAIVPAQGPAVLISDVFEWRFFDALVNEAGARGVPVRVAGA